MKIPRLVLAALICLGVSLAPAADAPAPPAEPTQANAAWAIEDLALVLNSSFTFRTDKLPAGAFKPLVWVAHEAVAAELIATEEIKGDKLTRRVHLYVRLPEKIDFEPDTVVTPEQAKARAAVFTKWTHYGIFGRRLPVTILLQPVSGNDAVVLQRPDVVVRLISTGETIATVLMLVIALGLAIYAVRTTRMLFDPKAIEVKQPGGPNIWRWQFSLSRVQGFVWLIVVYVGVLFLYATTGSIRHVLNPTALALLAIGAGTSFIALMLEQPTPTTPATTTDDDGKPPPGTKVERPAFRLLLADLLDAGREGNIHRLQIVIWTISLVAVYLHRLFANYALPEFDGQTLALMGVSSATYLSFKSKEK